MEKINFKDLNLIIEKNEKILIMFSTKWCGQCKMASLLIEKIRNDFSAIKFIEVDVDDDDLWDHKEINIIEVPTFIGYTNKKRILNVGGYQIEENLRKLLKKL